MLAVVIKDIVSYEVNDKSLKEKRRWNRHRDTESWPCEDGGGLELESQVKECQRLKAARRWERGMD
jgi:hypothetical protein